MSKSLDGIELGKSRVEGRVGLENHGGGESDCQRR